MIKWNGFRLVDAINRKWISPSTRGEPLVLGIDFDNTIVDYGALMWEVASERGLIGRDHIKSKKAIRDSVRCLSEGELCWRRVQAVVYGDRMQEAQLMPGVGYLLLTCKRHGFPVYIISHKTELSNLGESDTNFRAAALAWLESFGFFDSNGFGLERDNVFFHDTREAKIRRIKTLKVTHFIDDLEELFCEPSFPKDIVRIHFAPLGPSSDSPMIHSFASWDEIAEYLFNGNGAGKALVQNG